MTGERPGLFPRGRPKRPQGWAARIAKAGVSGAVAIGVVLLAWAQLFPCAARRAGLKAIKLGVADFEVPACADGGDGRGAAGATTTTASLTSTTADTTTTTTAATTTTLALAVVTTPMPVPTPTPCPTAGWARPSGGPHPGCECGTQFVHLKPDVVSGRAGYPIGIEWEANPICLGQEGRDAGSTVSWGDGTSEPFIPTGPSACFQHAYRSPGRFHVQIAVRVRCLDLGRSGCREGHRCDADGELYATIDPR
jgi:hypothetical protein